MQEFQNTELKPYNALTREEKHLLLDAAIDGNVEFTLAGENSWAEKIGDDFYPTVIYRTKPQEYKKLNICWESIQDEWRYAAMDVTGFVYFYADAPKFCTKDLRWYGGRGNTSNLLKLDTTGIVAEHSLTERPKGV